MKSLPFCLSHVIEPHSSPAKENTAAYIFEKMRRESARKLGQFGRTGMPRCKSATKGSKAVSQTATLAAALGEPGG